MAASLQDILDSGTNPVDMLRNSKIGMYVYPVVAPEFSNWRDEQRAWRDTAVLFDQSHHMDEVIVEGPQAADFLDHVGINSFANFDLNRAKHFVPVTPAGHVIGDMIIFREREDKFILVGRAPTANWVQFQAAVGTWNVRAAPRPALGFAPRRRARSTAPTTGSRSRAPRPTRSSPGSTAARCPTSSSSTSTGSRSARRRSRRCATAWPARRGWRSGGPMPTRPISSRRSCRPPATSASTCARSAAAPIPPTPWNPAGFRRRCRHLHRRRNAAGLPPVARRRQLRGDGLDRRQLRVDVDRGLLRQPVRTRLRLLHRLEIGLHRQGRPDQAEGRAQPQEGDVRVESPRTC